MVTAYVPAPSLSPSALAPAALLAGPAPSRAELASLSFGTQPIDARRCVVPGTGRQLIFGWLALLVGTAAVAASTMGIGLIGIVIAPLVDLFRWRRVRAQIRGSGVHVGPDQLPEIHRCVEQMSKRLGLKHAPEVYVVESAMLNAAAVKLGTKDIILLTDDVVWGALHAGEGRSLGFVLGHELAHVALGHTKTLRGLMRNLVKALGRADEFTADAVAHALIGDDKLAVKGITLLAVGPQLLPYINEAALERQALEIMHDKHAKRAERSLTHPLLFRRIAHLLQKA